jgi:uncharacterized membrane protein (DUF2068 family)
MRELRVCGRRGHVTYAPVESEWRTRLQAQTDEGEAWRCLRCGDFVAGPPAGAGPAADMPRPRRGKALRQELILRILAVERLVRGLVLLAGAYAVVRFRSSEASLRRLFDVDLPSARPLADRLGLDLDHSSVVTTIHRALTARPATLAVIALFLGGYGSLQLVEAFGLWRVRRWGEYLTVVSTAAFLPLEVREIIERPTAARVVTLIVNIAAVVYLLLAKRLFGLRGGREADERELEGEALLAPGPAGADDPGSPAASPYPTAAAVRRS